MIFEQDFAQPHSINATRSLWRKIFQRIRPLFGDIRTKTIFSLVQSGTTFEILSDYGGYILKECIEIYDLRTLMPSCGGSEKKLGTRTQRHWFGSFMSFQLRRMRSFGKKESEFLPILILKKASLRANVKSALHEMNCSIFEVYN